MSVSPEPQLSLKRDHDSFNFDDLTDLEQPFQVPPELAATYATQPQESEFDSGESSMPTPPVSVGNNKREASPLRSRSASLTDPASATPSLQGDSPMPGSDLMPSSAQQARNGSPSPSAFAALNGNGTAPPPAKKVKLSFAEREAKKEMERIQKEIKDQEKATEKARKDRERQAQAEDKARRDAEKETERKNKEAEKETERKKKEAEKEQKRVALEAEKAAKEEKKRMKEAEKQKAEEEKAAKEEKKRMKEAEKQKAEEEKRKKERKQPTLGAFFTIPAATTARRNSVDRRSESPAPLNPSLLAAVGSPAASTPRKAEKTAYEKTFPDFYIYPNVTMAPINRFGRDEEASDSLQSLVDSYILGNRSPGRQHEFDATTLFHLSSHDNVLRGKRCIPVREIMAEFSGKSTRPIDLTTDSQNTQIKRTNDYLHKIPLKFLKFQEDVRPPYRGTYTNRPVNGMSKLARNPMRRDLPDTNYEYDSEAEWIEDEDAEDLNSEGEEDEELGEDGEDMEGFLDDENDEAANSKRLVLQGDLEPVSTGLCWEDQRKRNTNVKMMPYRMEIILDHTMKSIDPFSTRYWQKSAAVTSMDPPRLPLNALKSNSLTVNSLSNTTKAVKPFFTAASDTLKLNPAQSTQGSLRTQLLASAPASVANAKPKKLIPQEDMPTFRQEIAGSDLSKVGLVEVLKKKFPGRSAAMIKSTLELVAKRVGAKEADKRWVLIDETHA